MAHRPSSTGVQLSPCPQSNDDARLAEFAAQKEPAFAFLRDAGLLTLSPAQLERVTAYGGSGPTEEVKRRKVNTLNRRARRRLAKLRRSRWIRRAPAPVANADEAFARALRRLRVPGRIARVSQMTAHGGLPFHSADVEFALGLMRSLATYDGPVKDVPKEAADLALVLCLSLAKLEGSRRRRTRRDTRVLALAPSARVDAVLMTRPRARESVGTSTRVSRRSTTSRDDGGGSDPPGRPPAVARALVPNFIAGGAL